MKGADWHETAIRVRYKDTDCMGVVYYGNYLTYFEIGRIEYMRARGAPYSLLESKGLRLVVTDAAARFHANVGYDAALTVRTRASELAHVRMRFEYEVADSGGRVIVTGHTMHACLGADGKPKRIPPEVRNVLKGGRE